MSDPTPRTTQEPTPEPTPEPTSDPTSGPSPSGARPTPWWRRAGLVGGLGAVVGFTAGLGGAVALHELTEGDHGGAPAAFRGGGTEDPSTWSDDRDDGAFADDDWSAAPSGGIGAERGPRMGRDESAQGQMGQGQMGQGGPADAMTGAS